MGDLKNSLARLGKLLKLTRYPHASSIPGEYTVADLLRILHHALLDYSRLVAAFILEKGYDLYGKTDMRFVDHCFRLLREEFQYFPSMTTAQFLSTQFLDRKLQLTADILEIVMKKHEAYVRQRRQEQAVWTKPREPKSKSTHIENHHVPSPPPQPVSTPPIDTKTLLSYLRHDTARRALEQKHGSHAQAEPGSRGQVQVNAERVSTYRMEHSKRDHGNQQAQSESSSTGTDGEQDLRDGWGSDTPHRPMSSGGCGCTETKQELHDVLATLSKQINDLSSAVVSRVATIESRLNVIEKQVQEMSIESTSGDVSTLNHGTRSPASSCPGQAQTNGSSSRPSRFKSSWPPDPALFGDH